ncbi:MAG: hypothetical protein OEZ22_15090 [Spirochaetia bacterium]|nr:hypothetical protein [Spirochaetia bacterium]
MKNLKINAAQAISRIFGVLGAIGGGIHGIGEILQGNVKPENLFISSWATGPIALYFDGDPGLTVLPSMLIAGITTVVIASIIIIWSVRYLKNKKDGFILIVLAILLLLSGGGVGPPILTLIAGIAGLGIGAKYVWWNNILGENAKKIIAKAWPFIYTICLFNGIFLVIGHIVAAYFFAPVEGDTFSNSFLLSIPLLILSIITGIYFDLTKRDDQKAS